MQELNANIDKDVCTDIAEEADKVLATITNTLNVFLQLRASSLLNYVTIVVSTVMVLVTAYTIALDIESLLTSNWALRTIVASIVISIYVIAFSYIYTKFKRTLGKLLDKTSSPAGTLKKIGYENVELFKHYQKLSSSCHQKLCKDSNTNDPKISMLCEKLYRLQKIDSNELSSSLLSS